MPSIHLRGLSYAHTPALDVLADVDLDLHHDPVAHDSGWVGVVGANGGGKSTLLRLLAGELHPTAGTVNVESDVPPVLLHQEAPVPPPAVRAFAADWDGHAQRLRSRLELDVDDLDDRLGRGWDGLSPGLRTRWRVAAALAAGPDVLLLDEPTNHLDTEGRDLLLDALHDHPGLGLVVSHDRTLLDAITTRTLRVGAGDVELHDGPYREASRRWRAEEARLRAEADRATRAARRERAALGDLRRARHGAEASAARDRRVAGHRDHDAHEAGRRFVADRAEATLAARVRSQRSRVARVEAVADVAVGRAARDHRGAVDFRTTGGGGAELLARVVGDVRHAGGGVVLHDVDVALRRGERVHLAGANGAGKSSLLAALLDRLAPSVSPAVLPQEVDEEPRTWLPTLDPDERGRVLGTAARLGVVPARVLDTGTTSPGERRKLALARLLVSTASLVVLDEPTNHLDLPAVEALQDALAGLDTALLLVTHDHALAAAATDVRWDVGGGAVTRAW